MLRLADYVWTNGLGQVRPDDSVDQFAKEREIREAGLRPDLFPTDTMPMGLVYPPGTPNPGEQILLKEGWILPLQPEGPESVLVYPEVVPTPSITQNIAFEDQYPRDQHRNILRGRTGIDPYGPFEPPSRKLLEPYRPLTLGQPEEVPIMILPGRPGSEAYQTYPGPFLGDMGANPGISYGNVLHVVIGGAMLAAAFIIDKEYVSPSLYGIGVVVAGIGLASMINEAGK